MSRPANKMEQQRADEARRVDVTDRAVAPAAPVGNGSAIAALVVGLLAATFGFLVATAPAAILFGLIAVVLGAKGMGQAKKLDGLYKGLALSGLISGLLGIVLGIAVVVGGVTLFSELQDRAESGDLPPEIQQPVDDLTGS